MTSSEVVLTMALTLAFLTVCALAWWGRQQDKRDHARRVRLAEAIEAERAVQEFTGNHPAGKAIGRVSVAMNEIYNQIGPPPGWRPHRVHTECFDRYTDGMYGLACADCVAVLGGRTGVALGHGPLREGLVS